MTLAQERTWCHEPDQVSVSGGSQGGLPEEGAEVNGSSSVGTAFIRQRSQEPASGPSMLSASVHSSSNLEKRALT